MATRNEFVERQHDEVRETLDRLRKHLAVCEERLQEDPESAECSEMVETVREGIAALEPVMNEFDNADVSPEELINYAQTIEDWQAKESEIGDRLK